MFIVHAACVSTYFYLFVTPPRDPTQQNTGSMISHSNKPGKWGTRPFHPQSSTDFTVLVALRSQLKSKAAAPATWHPTQQSSDKMDISDTPRLIEMCEKTLKYTFTYFQKSDVDN